MSVERAIHELWATDHRLVSLVPAERVLTGAAGAAAELPYVVLARQANRPLVRTSSGTAIDETALRITIRAARLDEAKRIADEVRRRFDRLHCDRAGVAILDFRRAGDDAEQEPRGDWRLALDYLVLNEPLPG